MLGIDPGLSRCGYGAVRREGSVLRADRLRRAAHRAVRRPAGRLAALDAELEALVAELRPVVVAVERVLFQANVRTAIAVGRRAASRSRSRRAPGCRSPTTARTR